MHLNPGPIAYLSVPMPHGADGTSHQIKGECFVGVTPRRFDCIHLDPGPMRVDLGGLMAHIVDGGPHRMEGECLAGVLQSNLDSLRPGTGFKVAGSTVPVTQGLVDGVFHRVRGECFDVVAQSNQGFIQPLRTDLSNDVLPSEKLQTVPSSQILNQMNLCDVRFKHRVNLAIVKQRQLKLFKTVNQPKGLLGGHFNIYSIMAKCDEMTHLVTNSNVDFFMSD